MNFLRANIKLFLSIQRIGFQKDNIENRKRELEDEYKK
jgi:hypothetical protein